VTDSKQAAALSADEIDWRQVEDHAGLYVHKAGDHAYPGMNAWRESSCSAGDHAGCIVLEAILQAALEEGDMKGVGYALELIALQDPHRAQLLMDTMKVGIAISKERLP